ncbi:2-succinyl-5-enolpyruvyl-6-hydroxy-3-cyclohexene-1-carboxylate synthase [Abyssalbus ytuae]|uniref:2-succinyl-5-enolpyruvyl-6-hydroxy-3-cyclohexene-1-carboxylate synthase n=1 Tax=Abyssalbus ytuae TaxID=2926907 RepID=A0A9E7CZ71_9FLAO|nr:2-succinyl-5-enolpyruvyl-6-hydroxy-3-cyclohexene-1-carboxylate synthase [Abyssalbus ytuae]UOB17305.1 thiamine pyrophosphate-dependent enzyme [Abyssalbus ytuae]
MKYPKIPLAQTVVQLCKHKNIKHIVISPGSRNAPLTIGFTEDSYFKNYSIVDERCASFFALGIAQQIQKPVAIVCTSGSALLNYYPAVSEAFYSDIPLVVISADRPPYSIDIGDGQTIRQENVFEKHILFSANLKQDIRKEEYKVLGDGKNMPKVFQNVNVFNLQEGIQKNNEHKINKALNTAIDSRGPVHINVPFEEPLYEVTDSLSVTVKNIVSVDTSIDLTLDELTKYAHIWNTSDRKMILTGVNYPESVDKVLLAKLASDESVIVFTETTSNIHHDNFFPGIDKIIAPVEYSVDKDELFKKLQPDILLTFGGMVVSKKIKAFLRKYKPKHHWHIDLKKAYDTYYCLEKHFKLTPNDFFKKFLPIVTLQKGEYRGYWEKVKNNRREYHKKYIQKIEFSDFKAFHFILNSIPDFYQLQLGNSSTIRYTQLFDINPNLRVFCNRGTSGIEGSTSTAVGASVAYKKPTIFITGDLSFFYDSNALWNKYIRPDFRIIVVNNEGGGIFRILPGQKNSANFDTYFETVHSLDAQNLCKMYGVDYLPAHTEKDLIKHLSEFYEESDRAKLLEVFTPRKVNDEILIGYFKYFSENS